MDKKQKIKEMMQEIMDDIPVKALPEILMKAIVHKLCDMEIKISKGIDGEVSVDIVTDIPEQLEDVKDSEVLSLLSNALVGYFSDMIAKISDAEDVDKNSEKMTGKFFEMMKNDIAERARENVKEKEKEDEGNDK